MKNEKLFQLLVIGGALLINQPASAHETNPTEQPVESPELAPLVCDIFDPNKPAEENTCVQTSEGEIIVKDGFYCCWGTACS